MNLSFLPAVNATLNGLAAVLLTIGLVFILKRKINAHRNCMIAAFVTSCVFLVSYVTHYVWRYLEHGGAHTLYHGTGGMKAFYYIMLATHIILAMIVPFLAITLLYLGFKRRDVLHRRIARFAWPVWMYVSITGVLIYLMLYHFNPPAGGA